jgi:hypothetical protein
MVNRLMRDGPVLIGAIAFWCLGVGAFGLFLLCGRRLKAAGYDERWALLSFVITPYSMWVALLFLRD